MIDNSVLNEAASLIQEAKNILVTAHVRPDGDAVSAVLAMGLALEQQNKNVQMVLQDGVPSSFRFLNGSERIVTRQTGVTELVIVLDCGSIDRVGNAFLVSQKVDINIDHHPTNTMFGDVNIVDSDAAATTQILSDILPKIGLEITADVAEALLTGILADTQGFKTLNTSPEALRIAAELYENGADFTGIYDKILSRKSFKVLNFWAASLAHLEREGEMVWTSISSDDRKSSGYSGLDDADLINLLSSIDSANVAMIFIEQDKTKVKVSWRANSGFDVSRVAMKFGGGGHVAAAGAMVEGSLQEVKDKVINLTKMEVFDLQPN